MGFDDEGTGLGAVPEVPWDIMKIELNEQHKEGRGRAQLRY